jgi:hypothetical protein
MTPQDSSMRQGPDLSEDPFASIDRKNLDATIMFHQSLLEIDYTITAECQHLLCVKKPERERMKLRASQSYCEKKVTIYF